ncbi:MAG: tetratricopeptide repeat protein [Blastocatellia bacterium]
MNKENSLYAIIGLLAGLIIGYAGTNYINGDAPISRTNTAANAGALPPDHPPASGDSGASGGDSTSNTGGGAQGEVMAVIGQARNEPSNFDAQMKAADLFFQINRKDGAIEFYERATKIKPNDFDLLVKLGDTTFDLQRFEDAAKWYEQALKIKADTTVRMDLGLTYYLRSPRDLDRAIENFRAALKSDPRHEKTLQNLTRALIDKGEKSAAAESLKQLEQVNSGNPAIADLRSRLQS